MKKFIILLLIYQFTYAQTQNKKIKVILLGTFHFGATTDRNSTKFEDVFSEKRQIEFDIVAKQLSKNRIDKIFIEDTPDNQTKRNLQFEDYKNSKITEEKVLKNEWILKKFDPEASFRQESTS